MVKEYGESEAVHNESYWCAAETFNKWIMASLKLHLVFRSVRDCHFLPQIEYMFDDIETQNKKLYTNVLMLGQSDFYGQFGELMNKYGLKTDKSLKSYSENVSTNKFKEKRCLSVLGIENIDNETKTFIQEVYRKDFEYFNFTAY